MAKNKIEKVDEASAYPSRFGSHASMLDTQATELGKGKIAVIEDGRAREVEYELQEDEVFLNDENGLYATKKERVDNGMADPNRYSSDRLHKQLQINLEKKDKE
jgi:hypothetical protein